MKYSFIFLAVIVVCLAFSNQINSAAAQFSYFVSSQLAPSPSNGDCLTTNGTTNAWGDCGTGGGGTPGGSTTQVQFNNAGSFAGDSGMTYSSSTDTLSIVSINATNSTSTRLAVTGSFNLLGDVITNVATWFQSYLDNGYDAVFGSATTTHLSTTNATTTRLAVTGTGTTTFAGGINTGTNHIVTHGVQSDASDGLHVHAGNGTDVALFGAGNTANSLFYGAVNIDGSTRIATATNGVLVANSGTVTASGTPTVASIVATGTTATSTFAGSLQVNGGTLFVDATNNRVGIGTTTPGKQVSIVSNAVRTPYISFYDHLGNRAIDIISATSSTASSTAFGLESLQSVTTATGLTAFGSGALRANTTGSSNTAFGAWALRALTTGGNNTAIGLEAGQAMTSGGTNTSLGSGSIRQTTSGSRNIGIGYQALYANTIGASNIAIGNTSARYLADGVTTNIGATSSIYIGHDIRSASAGSSNEIVIGNYLTGNGTNTATFGNSSLSTLFAGKVGIGTTTPPAQLSIQGTSTSRIMQLVSDAGTKFMEMLNTGVTTLLGTWDFSGATVKQHTYKSFSFPTFATTTSATTTIDLGTAYTAESWSGADCYVSSGSGAFIFTDGTNRMNGATATTTVSRTTLSTNNTFTAQEKRYMEVGALTNAKLVCTVDIIVNN